jgi:hypothetical protein
MKKETHSFGVDAVNGRALLALIETPLALSRLNGDVFATRAPCSRSLAARRDSCQSGPGQQLEVKSKKILGLFCMIPPQSVSSLLHTIDTQRTHNCCETFFAQRVVGKATCPSANVELSSEGDELFHTFLRHCMPPVLERLLEQI